MKYIAKCKTGKEYAHTLGYYTRNDSVAQTVADALNDAKHELKNGEHWHVYDVQNSDLWYQCNSLGEIYLTTSGNVKVRF